MMVDVSPGEAKNMIKPSSTSLKERGLLYMLISGA